jgi:hypothetical protein
MEGRAAPDRLGRKLPRFITPERAIAWSEHPFPATVEVMGARRWPVPGERWVVVVAGKAGPPGTAGALLTDVRLVVVDVTRTAGEKEPTVRRLARTIGPLASIPEWGLLPDDLRPTTCLDDCKVTPPSLGLDDRTTITALDFATYDLTPSERAFGVRVTVTEGYSGGFGSFESITLFQMERETLVPILDVPIAVQKMTAGDWNRDGSRQHDYADAELVIDVLPRALGKADLLLRSVDTRRGVTYQWLGTSRGYSCSK